MPHTMNVAKTEIVFLAEFCKPEIRRIVIHRSPIILYKQPVIINPLASQLYFFLILFGFVRFEQIHHDRREF